MSLPIWTVLYVSSVVLANVMTAHLGLVDVGFGLQVTAGTFAAGAALLFRDFVHRGATDRFGNGAGIRFVISTIAAAGSISWLMATPALAVASTVAFVAAELVDLGVFAPLRSAVGFAPAAAASNVVSAPVDTILFLAIAGFPITVAVVAGQLLAKLLYATVLPLLAWFVFTPELDPA